MPLTTPALGLLLVVLIWGGNFTATKLAFTDISPLAFTAVRFALGSVLMWLILARREGWRLPPRATWLPLIALGVVGNTIYQLCFMTGLYRTTATNSSLILASMPTVVTVGGGAARLRADHRAAEVGTGHRDAGRAARRRVARHRPRRRPGSVTCSCSPPWSAGPAYTLGLRTLTGRMSTLALTTWTLITGTPGLILAGVPSVAQDGLARGVGDAAGAGSPTPRCSRSWWRTCSGIVGVRQIGPSRAALFTTLTPLVATLTAIVVLGERPGWLHLAGGAMIIAGVLVSRRPVRPTPARCPDGSAEDDVALDSAGASSSSRAMARRRCGMTMLPPTTRPTEKISRNSSRVVPSS